MVVFADRRFAGALLGPQVAAAIGPDAAPVVLGLPRGGMPVAEEVAAVLSAPLDVLLVRKVGTPGQRELAMGAVGEDGAVTSNPEVLAHGGVPAAEFERAARRERRVLARRVAACRAVRSAVPVAGRVVVVVDDGVATGATARTAGAVLRARGARVVVLATPVISPAVADALVSGSGAVLDRVVAVLRPEVFGAVGQFYLDFAPTTDGEVLSILRRVSGWEP